MARHNREGYGADQRGFAYEVNYQPDWLRHVKVTRVLQSGRQSTKTLFRNPADRQEASPGERVRTRILSPDQGLDFEVAVTDLKGAVARIRVAYMVTNEHGEKEEIEFTLENELPPPPPGHVPDPKDFEGFEGPSRP
jgi:hypothetical protein